MRWTPRQLMLPVLIGMSLTGVSLGIIYLLIEKENEKDKVDRGAKGQRFRGFQTLEFQVPREFVPVVIGRGGSMIKSIENTTETRINFEQDDPEMSERTCFVRGTSEGLRMAETMIQNLIASQPLIETYETYIPQRFRSRIIGRDGETIHQIQLSSRAKIIIEKTWSHDPNSKQRVIIKGTAEQIASALTQIEDKVHEYTEILEKLAAGEASRSPRGKISPKNATVDTPADVPLPLQPMDDGTPNGGTMEVYVSAIENPSQFWVQVAGPTILSLDDLVDDMTAYYEKEENRELHVLNNVTLGQTVAAKFLLDGKWYRAEITSILDNGGCEVHYSDYGNQELVSIEHVLELRTDFLSLRLQAIECSLANVKPRDGEWSAEACDRFGDLTWVAQWKVLIAKVRGYKERALGCGSSRREGSPIPCVDLYDKNDNQDVNIGKQMVVENFAEAEEGAWSTASSTLSLSRRSNDNARSPTPVRSPPPPPSPSTVKNATASTPEPRKPQKKPIVIEEVDLTTTPQKSVGSVVEIDLVTPVKGATRRSMENEKSEHVENGGGDTAYGNENFSKENGNSNNHAPAKLNILPAGYDSDDSDRSDDFTLG